MSDVNTHFRGFGPKAFAFLKGLTENNDREWFQAHKADYEREAKAPMMDLVADLSSALARRELPLFGDPRRAIFRINRDIRFAKDKSPYKTHVSAVLTRDGNKHSQGLLYLHVGVDEMFVATGFHMLDPDDLAAFRDRIVVRRKDWLKIVEGLAAEGLELSRESALTRLPRGYDAAEVGEIADFLRLKSFTTSRRLGKADLIGPDVVDRLADFAVSGLPLLEFGWRALENRPGASR